MCVNVRGKYKVYVKTQQDFQAFVVSFFFSFGQFWVTFLKVACPCVPANACVWLSVKLWLPVESIFENKWFQKRVFCHWPIWQVVNLESIRGNRLLNDELERRTILKMHEPWPRNLIRILSKASYFFRSQISLALHIYSFIYFKLDI